MFTWICGFVCDCWLSFMFYAKKKKKKRKEERDIKYNEKDTFIPIFNNEKGEVGNRGSNGGHLR